MTETLEHEIRDEMALQRLGGIGHGLSRTQLNTQIGLDEEGILHLGLDEMDLWFHPSGELEVLNSGSDVPSGHLFDAVSILVLGMHPDEPGPDLALRQMRGALESALTEDHWSVPGQLELIEADSLPGAIGDSIIRLRKEFTMDDDVLTGALTMIRLDDPDLGPMGYRDEELFELLRLDVVDECPRSRRLGSDTLATIAETERARQVIRRSAAGRALGAHLGLGEPDPLPRLVKGGAPVPDGCTVTMPRGYRLHSDGVQLYAMPLSVLSGEHFDPGHGFAVTGEVLASWADQEEGITDGAEMAAAVKARIAQTTELRHRMAQTIRTDSERTLA